MHEVVFCLGSNLGDRKANILVAIERLDAALGHPYISASPLIQTAAIGFDGPDFINCAVKYNTDKSPFELLRICKEIERSLGRNDIPEFDVNGERIYHDRVIDIDILTVGDIKMKTPALTLPHPQVRTRPYIKELLLHL